MRRSLIVPAILVFVFAIAGTIFRQAGVESKWLLAVFLVLAVMQYFYFRNKKGE
jgi:hypothetical protein